MCLFFVVKGVGKFFFPTLDSSGMNYQQQNRALSECIRDRCEKTGYKLRPDFGCDASLIPNIFFPIWFLFFCYEPLCMSLHDAASDDSWSDRIIKNSPTPQLIQN